MKGIVLNYSLFTLFLFLPIIALAQEGRKVAVFDPSGTVENALLEIVREEISSVVVNTSGYSVLERQLINKVLEENRFQESGLVNDEQVSDLGKRMGADYVFVTTLSTLGENYYISCKMIEVATARIDKQSTGTTSKGMSDIPQTTHTIVTRLLVESVKQTETKQTPSTQQQTVDIALQSSENQSSDNYAMLHIYRLGGLLSSSMSYDLHLDDRVVFLAKKQSKITIRVTSEGMKTLWAKTESKVEISVNIKLGQEYYIRCGIDNAFFLEPKLEIVDNEKGKVEFNKIP